MSETRRATLVATLTSPLSDDGDELRHLPPGVDWLEVRADLVGDLDPDWLRDRFAGGLIYTLRSRAEGGRFEGGRKARRQRFAAASAGFDLVDLEAERDLGRELLAEIPAERRLVSWHGPGTHLTGLRQRFERVSREPARFYKLIPHANQSGDEIACLTLLHDLRRDDVICFAAGDIGSWTRILAPRLGCPLIYGAFGDVAGAPGQLTVDKLHRDFGLPELPDLEALFGIVGRPVAHSLSPRLHNGAYRALGLPAQYVAFHAEAFGDFWIEVVEGDALPILGLPLRGLSVTSPYKEVALAVSGASSPRAQYIEAANTLVWRDGVWEAESTDPEGVTLALTERGLDPRGLRAAVVGCGGAGKAAAYGLSLAGAQVVLANRGEDRGKKASMELGLPFVPLADFDPSRFDVLVHATSLGHRADDPLAFDAGRVRQGAAVVDMVYDTAVHGLGPTPLLERASAAGAVAIDGRNVLLCQALEQFRLMTGRELPHELAGELLALEATPPGKGNGATPQEDGDP